MAKRIQLTEAEARFQRQEIEDAKTGLDALQAERRRDQDAYYRKPLGNEKDGRCQLISSDVKNHVESQHPLLMRRFMATDHRVSFIGEDKMVAKALKIKCRETINDQGGFKFISDALKDGAISRFGVAKVWWRWIWGEEKKSVSLGPDGSGLTAAQVQQISKDKKYRILSVEEITGPTVVMEDPGEPEIGLPPAEFVLEQDKRYAVLVAHRPLKESGPVIENLPPEEFLHQSKKKRMNDRVGCGHIREMTVGEILREQDRLSTPGDPYFDPGPLHEALIGNDTASAAGDTSPITQEAQDRELLHSNESSIARTQDAVPVDSETYDLRAKRWVVEWCSWVVNGKKMLPGVTTWIGKKAVRCVENEDGIIHFCGWSPYPYPHKLIGGGIAQDHADEQEAHTLLLRAYLDSVGFSIDRARMVSTETDPLGLMELYPGKVVTGDIGTVGTLDVAPPDSGILRAIEVLKGDGEERGPGTRMNMGAEAPMGNKSATYASLVHRSAFNKSDLVALAFAELFLVDLYNVLGFLFQKNITPCKVMVEGEEVELSQETLKGDYRARAEIGLDVDFDDREYAKAVGLLQTSLMVAKSYPALYPLEKVHAMVRRVYLAAGEQDVGELVAAPPEQLKGWFPGIEQFMGPPPGAGGPPGGPPGAPPPSGLLAEAGSAENAGRDFVSGQGDSQPDETLFGG